MSENHCGVRNHTLDNAKPPTNLYTKTKDKGDTKNKANADGEPKT